MAPTLLPKPQSQGDFLKAEMLRPLLGKNGQVNARIVGIPEAGKYGVNVPVEIGKNKQPFVFTLSERGRDYRTVTDALGLEAAKWEDHTFVLGLRDGQNRDGEDTEYVTVVKVE